MTDPTPATIDTPWPTRPDRETSAAIPSRAGIGLRAPHYLALLADLPDVGWLEVHSENYFGGGGAPLHYLEKAREHYPLSLHGVGLSLGSSDPLDREHLRRLRALVARFEPGLVSDHLCWSSVAGNHFNDLLPLPYTEEALRHVVARIEWVQDYLGRELLVENVSTYLSYTHSTIPEWDFLGEVAERAGCGILLDLNNIYVSGMNHGFSPGAYLDAVPRERVREIHLAGHCVNHYPEGDVYIDHHGAEVALPVWELYEMSVRRLGPMPTLIEWDTDLPSLETLVAQAVRADRVQERCLAGTG